MKLSENIEATRIAGTLEITLEDGRIATLEVDLDVSSPLTGWFVSRTFDRGGDRLEMMNVPANPVLTTYGIEVPVRGQRAEFVLRIPVGDE